MLKLRYPLKQLFWGPFTHCLVTGRRGRSLPGAEKIIMLAPGEPLNFCAILSPPPRPRVLSG